MKDRNTKIAFLEKLRGVGIEFQISLWNGYGYVCIPPQDVIEYVNNPELYINNWLAEFHHITLRSWQDYRSFYEDPQCIGITRKGLRCKKICEVPLPQEYNPDIDRYCNYHSRLGG